MSKRVLTIIGTRPEAIKMAPVLAELAAEPRFESVLCASGQHTDLLRDALTSFGLRPDFDLEIMTEQQSLSEITSRCIARLAPLVQSIKPDLVLVHGDTATTLSAALVAFYQKVPVGHVEAGLRSGDFRNPFPEEMNRVLVDRIADYCFAPTLANRQNLLAEGVAEKRIAVTGNTAVDALLAMHRRVSASGQAERIENSAGFPRAATRSGNPLVLVTAHRRESFGDGIRRICSAIGTLSERHPDWQFVYPVHPNPNVDGVVRPLLAGRGNVHLVAPLDYEQFVYLMGRSCLILTDSGGIQEEAPSLGKPVVLLREVTERAEAVASGNVTIAGLDAERIVEAAERLVSDKALNERSKAGTNPYGDGMASPRIVDHLRRVL